MGASFVGTHSGALFWPGERFTHPAAVQNDVIGQNLRKSYARRDVLAFMHGKYLFGVKLHHRVPKATA